MRLYSFQGRYGHDKICRTEQKNLSIGDLLVGKSDMFLVLGEEVSRTTDKHKFLLSEELTIHHKAFFSAQTIGLIHRMTHRYYSSYKNVVKLFVSGELADLFKKEVTTKKKSEQSLFIYPDVWTMDNMMQGMDISDKGLVILNSTSTQQQKDKAWWGVKMGHIHTVHCTASEIFQDWRNLKYITLHDAHQRYYKSQQDPRYDTREVARKMADAYGSNLTFQGIDIFAYK